MSESFQAIINLATGIQSIKNKYPMVVTFLKHLQKCTSNTQAEEKEIQAFKSWLLENKEFPTITSPFYKSSKQTICFSNVYALGSETVISEFNKNLMIIENLLFPEGRPNIPVKEDMTPGVASAMAAIEGNPVLSGLLTNIKDVVADTDIVNDPSSILENKNFKVLLKNIQKGLDSGKYKISDISSTIHKVIGSVKNELDDEMNSVMSEAVGLMTAAERGQQPDISRIMELLKTVNFSK